MHEVISLLINRYDFFLQLLWEHIEISVLASVIATIIGGLLGVFIYEYKRLAAPVMVVVNFLYDSIYIDVRPFVVCIGCW